MRRSFTLGVGLLALLVLVPAQAMAQARSEDVDTGPATARPGDDLPWFLPPPQAAFTPPPMPTQPDKDAIEREAALSGQSLEVSFEPTGWLGANDTSASLSPAVFLRWAPPGGGLEIGYVPQMVNGAGVSDAFVFGGTFVHFGVDVYHADRTHLYLILPEVDLRALIATSHTDTQSVTTFGLGTSLIGLRFTQCLGGGVCFLAQVRAPTLFGYFALPPSKGTQENMFFGSAGAAISLGLGFN